MNVYPGQELMAHPDLQVDLSDKEPLIRPESLKELENEYLKVILRLFTMKIVLIRAKKKMNLFNCKTFRLWKRTMKIG